MQSETILFQSAVNASNQPVQQISNLKLTGFVTIDAYGNTDAGKLYGTFAYSSPTYTFNLYSDSGRTQLVASATATSSGLANVVAENNSGISGTVNIIPGTAVEDNLIEAICFLSTDNDIPLNNLAGTSDYDAVYGFSDFHVEAFKYVKNILQSRFESLLWNPDWIDIQQINSGKGGYDLSRILSWRSPDIREASAQYVLHLIARKQAVEPGGVFDHRSKCAYERCVALLQSAEISFDTNNSRVPRKTRNLSSFKISRA